MIEMLKNWLRTRGQDAERRRMNDLLVQNSIRDWARDYLNSELAGAASALKQQITSLNLAAFESPQDAGKEEFLSRLRAYAARRDEFEAHGHQHLLRLLAMEEAGETTVPVHQVIEDRIEESIQEFLVVATRIFNDAVREAKDLRGSQTSEPT